MRALLTFVCDAFFHSDRGDNMNLRTFALFILILLFGCTSAINKMSSNDFIVSYFEDEIERSVFSNSLKDKEFIDALGEK